MRYDLVIVGGGLVGAGLAAALRGTGIKIALIDARVPDNNDPRLFALNHHSCRFLENIDVWPALLPHASPIHQVHVSHQGSFGAVRLKREDVSLASLGHVVPARYIEETLNQMLVDNADVALYRPAKLKTVTQADNLVTLTLEQGVEETTIQSPLVIAADGADSTVRKELLIQAETFAYQQTAIVTRTRLQRSHQQVAYERFHAEGTIAMLPLPGDECATIWTADDAFATELMALDEEAFLAKLQQFFGYRLGRLQKIAKRHAFPLQLTRAEKMVQGGVLLLGNSAHAMHPVAAQGFNLALYEVAVLVDAIRAKHEADQIFTAADLQNVNQFVSSHQKNSINMSHRLARLFSGHSALKSHVLSLGMIGLGAIKPAKTKFINLMMGRAGSMPSLLMSTQDEKHFATSD